MTNDGEGNGYRRAGDLPERMRRLFTRKRGGASIAPGETAGTEKPAEEPDPERLRRALHAAVDRVMNGGDLPPEQLKRTLETVISRVVDEYAAETRRMTPHVASPAAPAGSGTSQPVDRVMTRLDHAVQHTLGSAYPGMERGRTYVAAQLPRLIERITPVLLEIAADEQRMRQVETALIRLLKTRMSETAARRVAHLAVSAARAAAWRRRRGSSG